VKNGRRIEHRSRPEVHRPPAKHVVRLGGHADVEDALSVYERSNLARRRGVWPSRGTRLEHVRANLLRPDAWFLVAFEGDEAVGMASVLPYHLDRGAGALVPGTAYLDLIYVLPDRWGRGIGGALLDAVIAESARRGWHRIHLSTHERDNERAQRLYASRGFRRTGTIATDDAGEPVAEWLRDG
jgi:[ribosomal protein S18]-alanine N-acetyltransferase